MANEIIKVIEYLLTNPVLIAFGIVGFIIFILTFGFTLTFIFKIFKSFNDDEFFNPKKSRNRLK